MSRSSGLASGLLVAAYLCLAGTYSVLVPLWEAPDEVAHFDFVAHLLRWRTLPVMLPGRLDEAHQPPLYYLLAALAAAPADLTDDTGAFRLNPQFQWAGGGGKEPNAGLHDRRERFPYRGHALAMHLGRAVSVLCGAVTVWFTILIGRRAAPGRPAVVGLLGGALVAFNPQFLFIHGALSNDTLVSALASAGLWQTLRAVGRPEQLTGWAAAGLLAGAALLTKLNAAGFAAAAAAALALGALRLRSPRVLVQGGAALAGAAAAVCGWWLIRNVVIYGDPLGWRVYRTIFGPNLRQERLTFEEVQLFLVVQLRSYWAAFGWMNVQAPEWFHAGVRALCWAAVAGFVWLAARRLWRSRRGTRGSAWLDAGVLVVLALALLAQEAYLLSVLTRCNASCYQGRYLFPVAAPIAVLLATGLVALVPRCHAVPAVVGLAATAATTAIYLLIAVIVPAYAYL